MPVYPENIFFIFSYHISYIVLVNKNAKKTGWEERLLKYDLVVHKYPTSVRKCAARTCVNCTQATNELSRATFLRSLTFDGKQTRVEKRRERKEYK